MLTSPATLIELVNRFGSPRILLIGDLMVDEYIYGNAERLSPEAPVPVVHERRREHSCGGAGNVATDLAVLGAQVLCVGVRGNDANGDLLTKLLARHRINTDGVIVDPSRPTTSKIRLVGLAQHRHPQQMLRLDQEDTSALSPAINAKILDYVKSQLPTCACVCIEDYNKGLLSHDLTQAITTLARAAGKPVLVDPAAINDYSKYKGATVITPNRTEAERATGLKLADSIEAAPALAKALLEQLDLAACTLTLDRHGIYLLEPNKPGVLHPTRPRKVYDVTGAGDMVLAAMAMAIAHGANWSEACDLANIAGGLEVEKFGCVPIQKIEILRELNNMSGVDAGKQLALPELLVELQARRAAGHKVVFTNGVFDILHAGHVQYLKFSRSQGDLLVVGVNSDDSVKRLKGPARPVNTLNDRLAVLAGLAAVDFVVPFDTDTPADLIRAVQPDVLVKGDDYAGKEVVGRDTVESRGGRVVLAPFLQGRSTTNIIEKSKAR